MSYLKLIEVCGFSNYAMLYNQLFANVGKILFAGKTGRATINNIDVATLKKLLQYLYTDSFDPQNANLVELVITY